MHQEKYIYHKIWYNYSVSNSKINSIKFTKGILRIKMKWTLLLETKEKKRIQLSTSSLDLGFKNLIKDTLKKKTSLGACITKIIRDIDNDVSSKLSRNYKIKKNILCTYNKYPCCS